MHGGLRATLSWALIFSALPVCSPLTFKTKVDKVWKRDSSCDTLDELWLIDRGYRILIDMVKTVGDDLAVLQKPRPNTKDKNGDPTDEDADWVRMRDTIETLLGFSIPDDGYKPTVVELYSPETSGSAGASSSTKTRRGSDEYTDTESRFVNSFMKKFHAVLYPMYNAMQRSTLLKATPLGRGRSDHLLMCGDVRFEWHSKDKTMPGTRKTFKEQLSLGDDVAGGWYYHGRFIETRRRPRWDAKPPLCQDSNNMIASRPELGVLIFCANWFHLDGWNTDPFREKGVKNMKLGTKLDDIWEKSPSLQILDALVTYFAYQPDAVEGKGLLPWDLSGQQAVDRSNRLLYKVAGANGMTRSPNEIVLSTDAQGQTVRNKVDNREVWAAGFDFVRDLAYSESGDKKTDEMRSKQQTRGPSVATENKYSYSLLILLLSMRDIDWSGDGVAKEPGMSLEDSFDPND